MSDSTSDNLAPVGLALGAALALAATAYGFSRLGRQETSEELVARIMREAMRPGPPLASWKPY